ncbi:hypothetical protein NN484_07955 [Pseudomonas serboccidentalis]|uniref:MFS transporter n=1 Tax=Pseudomonas serboccidentalis TaxID=2964670 RepID=A0ABY7ZEV5_9PSED|nr:hypothetical protein [Pseudomonas serboccidentalis]WDR37656.1 hypothetical protein NN484_07955 [Pseudomonas serboccidentalis]
MRLDDLRYYFSVSGLVVASAGFYAMVFMGGMRELFGIDESIFWILFWITFLFFAFFGLVYYVPRLRNVLSGERIEEKHYGFKGAWVEIVIVSITAAAIFAPFLLEFDFFSDVSYWVMAFFLFFLFLGLFCYLSFFQRSFRSRR